MTLLYAYYYCEQIIAVYRYLPSKKRRQGGCWLRAPNGLELALHLLYLRAFTSSTAQMSSCSMYTYSTLTNNLQHSQQCLVQSLHILSYHEYFIAGKLNPSARDCNTNSNTKGHTPTQRPIQTHTLPTLFQRHSQIFQECCFDVKQLRRSVLLLDLGNTLKYLLFLAENRP